MKLAVGSHEKQDAQERAEDDGNRGGQPDHNEGFAQGADDFVFHADDGGNGLFEC